MNYLNNQINTKPKQLLTNGKWKCSSGRNLQMLGSLMKAGQTTRKNDLRRLRRSQKGCQEAIKGKMVGLGMGF